MEINKIYNEDCLLTMSNMDDCFIDLVVTSPPYDNLREYKNKIDKTWGEGVWKPILKELYRVVKNGGVVVWIVGDATINGSETGTSFKQALFAMDCGFRLHDTMIYSKGAQGGAKGSCYCYTQSFEYMFIFSKGKIKTSNLLKDRENKYQKNGKSTMRRSNGKTVGFIAKPNKFSKRTNVWELRGGFMVGSADKISFEHPATFPEQLANDHILSWSNEGDLVYDPFMGSGTTAKMAIKNNRNWIGSEISSEYVNIANDRIGKAIREKEQDLFKDNY